MLKSQLQDTPLQFSVQNENFYTEVYNGIADVVYWNKFVVGYGSLLKVSVGNSIAFMSKKTLFKVPQLEYLTRPLSATKVGSKIYLFGIAKQGLDLPQNSIWLLDTKNKAMA